MFVLTLIYRYFRYYFLRKRLKKFFLQEQDILVNASIVKGINPTQVQYNILAFETFRKEIGISKGEMAILLREIFAIHDNRPSRHEVILGWISPLLHYYSDLDVLHFTFPASIYHVDTLDSKDPFFSNILTEYAIRKKFYLYRNKKFPINIDHKDKLCVDN